MSDLHGLATLERLRVLQEHRTTEAFKELESELKSLNLNWRTSNSE